jgi:peptidoglycan/LPS O-acetylase OafA/YrhL
MSQLLYWLAWVKNDPSVWAQAVHFQFGFIALLLAYREGRRREFWPISLGVVAVAFLIEVWYDPIYEHAPFFWGGFIDLSFYALGSIAGLLVDMYGWKDHPLRLAWRNRQ